MSVRAVALIHRPDDLVAVRLAAGLGDSTVLALLPDAPASEQLFEEARSAGAGRCIRVWDDALDATDYLGLALALASSVRAALGDLADVVVLTGESGRGAVAPALAEKLGLPSVGGVVGVQLAGDALMVRARAGEEIRTLRGKAPALLGVNPAAAAAAAAAAAEPDALAWTAAVAATESWDLAKVGLSPTELAYRRRFKPQRSEAPRAPQPRLFGSAAELAARLAADGLIGTGSRDG